MKYDYRAKERTGAQTTGEIEADSLADARQRLRGQGLFLLELAPQQAGGGSRPGREKLSRRKLKRHDIVMVLSQLTIMTQAGVDLAEALRQVALQTANARLREVLDRVLQDVSHGSPLSEALARHPRVFDDLCVASISAGEQTGEITQALERVTAWMRSEIRMRSAVTSMLIYPLVLCGVTFVVINAVLFFVLPQFGKVFVELERPAPPLTLLLLEFGEFVRGHVLFLAAGFALLGVAGWWARRTPRMLRCWHYAQLHLVLVRNATRSLYTGRTFRLLGSMLASGVPLMDAIRLCQRTVRNQLFRELFEHVEREALDGNGLARPLLASPFLPLGAANMVAAAERSGKLGTVLQSVGEYFEDEGQQKLRDLIKIVEPAIIVVLGFIVAGVVLAVLLPLLDVSTVAE